MRDTMKREEKEFLDAINHYTNSMTGKKDTLKSFIKALVISILTIAAFISILLIFK
jgi:hypothetical protein